MARSLSYNSVVALLVLICLPALAAVSEENPEQPISANTFAFEFSMGTQGILSFAEVGVRLPQIGSRVFVDVKARMMSSLNWATFIHLETGESVSFHPDVVGGVVSFGGHSPLLSGLFRMYGQTELFLGYSFTPWDAAIYGTGNLFSENLTYGHL